MASHPAQGFAAPASAADAAAPSGATLSQKELAGHDSTATSSTPQQAGIVAEESAEGIVLCRRYRLLEKLGAGAMGTVYRALDQKLDRQVAIKLLPERSVADAEAVARFRREAKALAKLSHPHIVQAYDADEDSGCHFLVMELVAGQTLAAVLREKGALSPTRAATIGYQAALGLAHAHERGLVHRDFKPSNLLCTADGQVKILDLGLARFLQDQIGDATLTTEGLGMGTPDYMAPEQFHDARRADARCDVYSLGCTLYHLIAGRVPFPTSSWAEKFTAHEQQTAPPLEVLCPDVPTGLAAAIAKMMAKRPEDRFQNALDAAEALAPYIAGSSQALSGIKATASWHGNQAGIVKSKGRERRRTWLVAAAGGGVLLAGLLALGVWAAGWFGGRSPGPSGGPTATTKAAPAAPAPAPAPTEPPDPNVLTVAKDGTAQFRTPSEALDNVTHPDMTILIRDAEYYDDSLLINRPVEHAGLTIMSPHGATLRVQAGDVRHNLVHIQNVERVRVSGLQLNVAKPEAFGVLAIGKCPGLVLEDLRVDVSRNLTKTAGVSCEGMELGPAEKPVVVQRCTFTGGYAGVQLVGKIFDGGAPAPVAGVCVQECSISKCQLGLVFAGRVNRLLACGNRIWDCQGGIILVDVYAGSKQLALINNSILRSGFCLGVVNSTDTGNPREVQDVELVNNLMLASTGPDLYLENATCNPGDWRKHHNWRQPPPTPQPMLAATGDRVGPPDALLSLAPSDPDFLRPKSDSPVAKEGAGSDLPMFIGAVPPAGAPAWNWQPTIERHFPAANATPP